MALWLPGEVQSSNAESCGATHLCLEFWRGFAFLGVYKLPLARIRQAITGQVQKALLQ